MSGIDIDLSDSDFAINRSRFAKIKHKIMETPGRLRLAAQGAWRGKERGLAVITGVFLSSLVITTVLAYGVGLSQLFFEESLKSENHECRDKIGRCKYFKLRLQASGSWVIAP